MRTITKNILEKDLENTCLYPKYPSGDLSESNPQFPFVDSSITNEQFMEEAERFNPLKSFWNILEYNDFKSLKNKDNIFVMHPFKQEIIQSSQLAIPIKSLMYLNHKGTTKLLNELIQDNSSKNNQTNTWEHYLTTDKLQDLISNIENRNTNLSHHFSENFVIKTPFSAAGDGVCIFDSQNNLQSSLENVLTLIKRSDNRGNNNFILQQFISGTDLSLQGFVSKSGETFYVGNGIQKIGHNGEYNGLLASDKTPNYKYLNILKTIGTHASSKKFYGFFGLDLKETQTGKLHIIDPNFRPTDGTPKYLKQLGII
jgi:predicted transcriptional regulator